MSEKISINHGSGGRQMHEFIETCIVTKLGNGILERMDDSAILQNESEQQLAMTTDSYVVSPIFFEGGDIGRLCVCGTVNDLATSGAIAKYLSLAFILEEGISLKTLEIIIDSIAHAAKQAGIKVVTGDTKVVQKGRGDQIYINTCGIGFIPKDVNISTYNAKPDDAVIITGSIGNHEVAMIKSRKMVDFDFSIESDVTPLNIFVEKLLKKSPHGINVVKDPTRGGIASALKEISEHSQCHIHIEEEKIPMDQNVSAICELLGFDPLYMANEGKYIIICNQQRVEDVLDIFEEAKVIGIVKDGKADVTLETNLGGVRRIGMLEVTQLPRIC